MSVAARSGARGVPLLRPCSVLAPSGRRAGAHGGIPAAPSPTASSPAPARPRPRTATLRRRPTAAAAAAARGPGEAPLYPPTPAPPSDPALTAEIAAAADWRSLAAVHMAAARRMDAAQLLMVCQRLAHLTGVLNWPEGAPLPLPVPQQPGFRRPALSHLEAQEVAVLAGSLCRATQVCLTADLYGLQQAAGLCAAFTALGAAPAASWLRAAELIALRTQRDSEGGRGASREQVNELLLLAGCFQRLGHCPDRAFTGLLADTLPLEALELPAAGAGAGAADGDPGAGPEAEAAAAPRPVLVVMTAPQLLTLARAVLLWGMAPPPEWPEAYLQATYSRITNANLMAVTRSRAGAGAAGAPGVGGVGGGLSQEEAEEAADAEAALGLCGLATLLWAAVVLGARPADPGGDWMSEYKEAALRLLRAELAAPPLVLVGGGAGSSSSSSSGGSSLQDVAALLSALQQVLYDPGADWVGTCLQAAALMQQRTATAAATATATATHGDAAASYSAPAGDALAAVLFMAAQYDHPQDAATREAVVSMAAAAQEWLQLQAGSSSGSGSSRRSSSSSRGPGPGPALFSSRGLTQLLMGLVRMGGRPGEAWMAAWGAAAAGVLAGGAAAGAGGATGSVFDADQVMAVMATAAQAGVELPERLQVALVGNILVPSAAAAAASGSSGSSSKAAGGAGVSAAGVFLPGTGSPGVLRGAPADAATLAAAIARSSGSGGGGTGAGGATAGGATAGGLSLPKFRQVLDVVSLQPHLLRAEWVEHFVELVQDFRLRLTARELLQVVCALSQFSDVKLVPMPAQARQAASAHASPRLMRVPPPEKADGSGSGSGGDGEEEDEEEGGGGGGGGVLLDAGWVSGLLDDLRARGGLAGPREVMQLAQALAVLEAPAPLLGFLETSALDLTGEDGRRKKLPAAAAAAPAAAAAAAPAAAAAAAPAAARIRLKLQSNPALQKAAAPAAGGTEEEATQQAKAAGSKPQSDSAAAAALAQQRAAAAAEAEEEEQAWALAWPAMLGTFAAGGYVPERRWWDRFAASTSPSLPDFEPQRLAATAAAALGISHKAAQAQVAAEMEARAAQEPQAARGGDGESGDGESGDGGVAAALLPNLEWHQQAFELIAGALQRCPLSMEAVRQAAAGMLAEQRRRQRRQEQQDQEQREEGAAGAGAGAAAAAAAAGGDGGDGGDGGGQEEGELGDVSEAEMREALMAASAELPALLAQLTAPRVPLPGELCELLAAMATEAAAAALAAATAGGGTGSTASAGGGEDAADGDDGAATDHLDDIMYCQQLICLVLQVFLVSEYSPAGAAQWWEQVAPVLLWSRPVWAPGSAAGQLEQQEELLLSPEATTTTAFAAGQLGLPLQPHQAAALLAHGARLAGGGAMSPGEVAALLRGVSGVEGALEGGEGGGLEAAGPALEQLLEAA
ncbi:hypothetical protein HYH02_000450 [Chlamydomonas schloesseri]|uniref:Uncharacterized protein n=1 Tax=Chlamydomonas schloesseri TaxID=2026947 RepID=A0A835WWA2_9CHLO|nr:hypothetical protein HYH02_000450 [Chlamydomonas schloesseri]|eukprot:KAG2454609.1 hypothetical protein HYH02_000450 [Chlamydomonas schloesseri]